MSWKSLQYACIVSHKPEEEDACMVSTEFGQAQLNLQLFHQISLVIQRKSSELNPLTDLSVQLVLGNISIDFASHMIWVSCIHQAIGLVFEVQVASLFPLLAAPLLVLWELWLPTHYWKQVPANMLVYVHAFVCIHITHTDTLYWYRAIHTVVLGSLIIIRKMVMIKSIAFFFFLIKKGNDCIQYLPLPFGKSWMWSFRFVVFGLLYILQTFQRNQCC